MSTGVRNRKRTEDTHHPPCSPTEAWCRLERFLFNSLFSRITLGCFYLFWFWFGVMVLRKTSNAIAAVRYVKSNAETVSSRLIENSREFADLIAVLDAKFTRPPAFFFLNQYALNMTDNFLCNTAILPGVHQRLVFVTLDTVARDTVKRRWPEIHQFHWPTPSLYKPFSFAEGPYQTIYLLRSNLALALIRKGKSFWMMQQDTFWRKSIFDLNLEDDTSYDAIFDQLGEGDEALRSEWANGANFFIRANNYTEKFFERMSDILAHWYTPDMGVMVHQCHTWQRPKCAYIPHKVVYSWEWMYTEQTNPPYLMQLDCETDGGSKLMQLGRYGFHFVNSDGTCNREKISLARERMENGSVEVQISKNFPSWGRLQFKIYWYITDWMLWTPWLGNIIKPYLPLAGFILIIPGTTLARQYTPTNVGAGWFDVPIKVYSDGKLSSKIGKSIIGDIFEFRGPYGMEEAQKISKFSQFLLIASGTGIAPLIRLVSVLLSEDNDSHMFHLIYAISSDEELLFREILTEWARHWNMRITVFVSRPAQLVSDTFPYLVKRETGRLEKEQLLGIIAKFEKTKLAVICCGSATFEKDVMNWTLHAGIASSNFIRFPP